MESPSRIWSKFIPPSQPDPKRGSGQFVVLTAGALDKHRLKSLLDSSIYDISS